MHFTSESVEALVEQFTKLPTIGRKTAQRLAAYVLKMSRDDVAALAQALIAVKDKVKHCPICHNVTDTLPCSICRSPKRDHAVICVVEEPNDVMALERTGEYRGVYHVLGGVISPLDGIGPDDLSIRELIARVDPTFKHVATAEPASNGQAEPQVAEAHPAFGYGHTNDPKKVKKFWKTGEGMRVNKHLKNNIGTSNKS